MEVKEAIEFLDSHFEDYLDYIVEVTPEDKFDEILDKRNETFHLLKSLQAENKALKKENEEYKGMWRWLSVKWGCSILDNSTPADFTLDDAMNLIETEYLGGGE